MKSIFALLFSVLLFPLGQATNWAILVAGSYTYSNYRHQSDIYHAYQVLVNNGFNPDHIITLAFDDIAHNIRNPFKGKVFNQPSYKQPGVNVYEGVKIDYKGWEVSTHLFLHVLEGNKSAVAGKGTGKVLQSTADDNVFLYFSDHGAPGLIVFPNAYLHADTLMSTFEKMKGRYAKFVFYLESCESGSMFTKLPNDTKIYSLSAANPIQTSQGCYCSPDDVVQGKHIGACLGDLFSVSFLQNSESTDVYSVNLTSQFEIIKNLTTKSHVMQWGDLSFQSDSIGQYIANSRHSINLRRRPYKGLFKLNNVHGVDSRFITIRTLSAIYAREKTDEAYAEMRQEMVSMQRFDDIFWHMQQELQLRGRYNPYDINHECMRAIISSFETKCGRLSDYGLIYVKYMAEACQSFEPSAIKQTKNAE